MEKKVYDLGFTEEGDLVVAPVCSLDDGCVVLYEESKDLLIYSKIVAYEGFISQRVLDVINQGRGVIPVKAVYKKVWDEADEA